MKNEIEAMITDITATTAEAEDYTGEDGLLYCGKCHTPKEAYFSKETAQWLGHDRHPAECDCHRAAREKREAAESRQKHLEKVEDLKRRGFTDPANMNTNDLNTALYEKMAAEQDKYRDWLKIQPPAEVLNHAYEYTVREDIVMAMEELELTAAQAQALLDSPTPLADVYRYFEKLETGYMDVVRDSIENRADDACKAQAELRKAAIYPHSAAYAKEHGELEQYRASNNANLQCKEAIEAAVREHFDGMYLSHDAAKGVIETYGMDRVMLVLANTVQLQDWDGRYSPRNKEWAKTIPNYNSDTVRCGYALNSHPAVLNGFIDLVREEHLRRQPLTVEDIQAEAERILRELRAPDMPNSPHGTHYMARISPEFLNRAGSKDHDRLMNLLPFRSLSFTGMKGLPGTYATILANEDRSKELRQPRPSVREHLKQEPKQAAPKAPGHKKREPER